MLDDKITDAADDTMNDGAADDENEGLTSYAERANREPVLTKDDGSVDVNLVARELMSLRREMQIEREVIRFQKENPEATETQAENFVEAVHKNDFQTIDKIRDELTAQKAEKAKADKKESEKTVSLNTGDSADDSSKPDVFTQKGRNSLLRRIWSGATG